MANADRKKQKDHFQLDVGKAIVHVHQAMRGGEVPTIRIECNGEEKTLEIEREDTFQEIEIRIQTMD